MLNIVKTPDREKYLLYTPPYASNPNTILSRANASYESLEQLFGKTVSIPKGFFYEEILKRDYPKIKIMTVKNIFESMQAVNFGKADAALGELAVFNYFISQQMMSNLKISGGFDMGNPELSLLNIATRKDLPILIAILKKAMGAVTSEEKQALVTRWIGSMEREKTIPLGVAFSDHFVIWEPRDVVGGDIYWLVPVKDGYILGVADCTGHGVPGAFLTLVATSALRFACAENPDATPAQLIASMNYFIKDVLAQYTDDAISDDGLELGVCRIDTNTKSMTFSGARFSLWIVHDGEVQEVKGDKTGIGYIDVPIRLDLKNHVLELNDDASYYMFSDGFNDQVGGERGRGYLCNYRESGIKKVIGRGREVEARRKDGTEFPADLSISEININGERKFVGILRDISERKEAENVIDTQRKSLLELSTPSIQLLDEIVLMPLVGTIDSERAGTLIEKLLLSISECNATVSILDVTGVPLIDTNVARHLLKAVTAAKMLGAEVILTGIRPSGAQTLVQLGVDLSGVTTKGSLRAGVHEALLITGRKLVDE